MTTPKVETFYSGGDRWYLHKGSGREVPGVSAIKDMLPKPFLTAWKARATAEYAVDHLGMLGEVAARDGRDAAVELAKNSTNRYSKRAADAGTDVHEMAEGIMRALMAGTKPAFKATKDEMRYLRNVARFIREFDVEPVGVETTVWSLEWDYAGTFDLLCRLRAIDNALCIVDWKTGASGVWGDHGIQQTAYRWADHYIDEAGEFQPMPKVERTYAVWLRPDGWALYPLRSDEVVWDEFKRLRATYTYRRDIEPSVVMKPINANPLKRTRRKR